MEPAEAVAQAGCLQVGQAEEAGQGVLLQVAEGEEAVPVNWAIVKGVSSAPNRKRNNQTHATRRRWRWRRSTGHWRRRWRWWWRALERNDMVSDRILDRKPKSYTHPSNWRRRRRWRNTTFWYWGRRRRRRRRRPLKDENGNVSRWSNETRLYN
jgi:hypothetical protein